MTVRSDHRALARQRILDALDEVVAQFTFQADRFQRRDAAAPVIITDEVTGWVSAIALALARYGEGEYDSAASLAKIAGLDISELSDENRTALVRRQPPD